MCENCQERLAQVMTIDQVNEYTQQLCRACFTNWIHAVTEQCELTLYIRPI